MHKYELPVQSTSEILANDLDNTISESRIQRHKGETPIPIQLAIGKLCVTARVSDASKYEVIVNLTETRVLARLSPGRGPSPLEGARVPFSRYLEAIVPDDTVARDAAPFPARRFLCLALGLGTSRRRVSLHGLKARAIGREIWAAPDKQLLPLGRFIKKLTYPYRSLASSSWMYYEAVGLGCGARRSRFSGERALRKQSPARRRRHRHYLIHINSPILVFCPSSTRSRRRGSCQSDGFSSAARMASIYEAEGFDVRPLYIGSWPLRI
ncbi:hypothetical protein EVAR_10779_1 [Eumeta japonica]|uniref:Uncharacterized protein n=1 Tax=Eumeta variegata TaxID=151549 RepID=A0A4C1W6W8_EUMVA|nr:hypothetical protein EVAR_10779_1 [Eumeta japonica]